MTVFRKVGATPFPDLQGVTEYEVLQGGPASMGPGQSPSIGRGRVSGHRLSNTPHLWNFLLCCPFLLRGYDLEILSKLCFYGEIAGTGIKA